MKVGIKKKIDKLGRIVIPKDIRQALGFEFNDKIELVITEEGLLILKNAKSKK